MKVLFSMQREFTVLTATSAREALDVFQRTRIHVVVTDQRMPEITGIELLTRLKEISPNTVGILLTGYADLDAIIASINEGEVFRYITKPWNNVELRNKVFQAIHISSKLFAVEKMPQFSIPQALPVSQPAPQVPQSPPPPSSEVLESANGPIAAPQPFRAPAVSNTVGTPAMPKTPATPAMAKQGNILVIHPVSDTGVAMLVSKLFDDQFNIRKATQIESAMDILASHDFPVVVADISGSSANLMAFIKMLKQAHPAVLVVIVTSSADANVAISLINQGQVYRFLPKPVQTGRLKLSVLSAVSYGKSIRQKPVLLERHQVEDVDSRVWLQQAPPQPHYSPKPYARNGNAQSPPHEPGPLDHALPPPVPRNSNSPPPASEPVAAGNPQEQAKLSIKERIAALRKRFREGIYGKKETSYYS